LQLNAEGVKGAAEGYVQHLPGVVVIQQSRQVGVEQSIRSGHRLQLSADQVALAVGLETFDTDRQGTTEEVRRLERRYAQRLEVGGAGRLQVHHAGRGLGDSGVDAELVAAAVQRELVRPQRPSDARVAVEGSAELG